MHDAAGVASPDPDRLLFLDSLRMLQCQLPQSPLLRAQTWFHRLLRELRRQELKPRRAPWYARGKMANWMKTRPEFLRPPQTTKPFPEAVVLLI